MRMLKKLFLGLFLLSLMVTNGHAAITSYDYTFVQNDVFSSDFIDRLNANFTRSLTGGINNLDSTNITSASLLESDMADEINPRIRTYEGAACEFVYTGYTVPTGASLTQNIAAGTAYPRGYRIIKGSATAHTFAASTWTWVDLDINGNFQYSQQSIGSSVPAVATNSVRLARVSTDAGTVVSVQDLRLTSCTNGPFNVIKDATGEASLADLFQYGNGGYHRGLSLAPNNSTSLFLNPGAAYINGKYRALRSQLTIPANTLANYGNGVSGLDAGTFASNTLYYVYGVADQTTTSDMIGVLSTSANTPSGATNYRRLGDLMSDAGSVSIATADVASISYTGKIVQIKKFVTGSVATGATAIPFDDTIPQSGEGFLFMSEGITPVNSNDLLKIDVVFYGGDSANARTIAVSLCQDAIANCLATGTMYQTNGPQDLVGTSYTYYMVAGTQALTTFKVRAGDAAGNTITFNGQGGTREYGGTLVSSITITEYQR